MVSNHGHRDNQGQPPRRDPRPPPPPPPPPARPAARHNQCRQSGPIVISGKWRCCVVGSGEGILLELGR